MAGKETGNTYVSLECPRLVDGEKENDILAVCKRARERMAVFCLSRPNAILHAFANVVLVERLDHEISRFYNNFTLSVPPYLVPSPLARTTFHIAKIQTKG